MVMRFRLFEPHARPARALGVVLIGWLAFVGTLDAQQSTLASRLSVSVQGTLFQPSAAGSVFDLARSELTLSAADFRHVRLGAEAIFRAHPRFSVTAGWSTGETEIESSIRRASIYGNGMQSTTLALDPAVTAGLAFDVARLGAEERWSILALAGAGRQGYQFRQSGTFPDSAAAGTTFQADLNTEGTGDLYYAELRVVRDLNQRLGLTLGARYQWSEAKVGGDYLGFDPISLSGLGITTGLRFQF